MLWFWKERPWLCPSLGYIFHSKCNFRRILEKNSKIFQCGASFSCVFWRKCLSKALFPKPPPPPPPPPSYLPLSPYPKKILVAHLHQGIILFVKSFILNVWQCSEYFCLDNCTLTCTVTFGYVLHQTHSKLLTHIHEYRDLLRHIQAYSGIFGTLCNPRIFTFLP